ARRQFNESIKDWQGTGHQFFGHLASERIQPVAEGSEEVRVKRFVGGCSPGTDDLAEPVAAQVGLAILERGKRDSAGQSLRQASAHAVQQQGDQAGLGAQVETTTRRSGVLLQSEQTALQSQPQELLSAG